MATTNETPLMKQFEEMKKKHPDAIILFRVGDFYETFREDAKTVSDICELTLTTHPGKSGERWYLAGFPHHALDTYLPKLVRAGKRVCICEENKEENKNEQKVIETVTPAQENKPASPKMKLINCNQDLRAKGEPIAYFHIDMPKEAKNLGKCVNKKRSHLPQLLSICVEPENNKLIVSDTYVLQTLDAPCEGIWPDGVEKEILGAMKYLPFQCNIDPKAINYLAGKRVDVAVWETEDGKLDVTACEADGVLAQYNETNNRFPDWQRVMPSSGESIRIHPDYIRAMIEWVKKNMGKTSPDSCGEWSKNNFIQIHTTPYADTIQLRMYEFNNDEYKHREIASTEIELSERINTEIKMTFVAPLFYLCIDGDFNGEIQITDQYKPAKFLGMYRESLLMPVMFNAE